MAVRKLIATLGIVLAFALPVSAASAGASQPAPGSPHHWEQPVPHHW